jgi:hypothetical protein
MRQAVIEHGLPRALRVVQTDQGYKTVDMADDQLLVSAKQARARLNAEIDDYPGNVTIAHQAALLEYVTCEVLDNASASETMARSLAIAAKKPTMVSRYRALKRLIEVFPGKTQGELGSMIGLKKQATSDCLKLETLHIHELLLFEQSSHKQAIKKVIEDKGKDVAKSLGVELNANDELATLSLREVRAMIKWRNMTSDELKELSNEGCDNELEYVAIEAYKSKETNDGIVRAKDFISRFCDTVRECDSVQYRDSGITLASVVTWLHDLDLLCLETCGGFGNATQQAAHTLARHESIEKQRKALKANEVLRERKAQENRELIAKDDKKFDKQQASLKKARVAKA